MEFIILIFILLIGFYSFKFIFGKAKLNKNFHIYKKDLIKDLFLIFQFMETAF